MVKNSIKVYARLKREDKKKELGTYEIKIKDKYEDIVFCNSSKPKRYRFQKIFDQETDQAEVFDNVAKPVINSVIEGFNGTIFAYGQTGSGKTYSITGSPKNYNDRGIIPRSIQHIFEHIEQISSQTYSIHISYMEIYNEIGYDLLNPKQQNTAMRLEELPRIILLEDKKGEAHVRNLSVLPVTSEKGAMRLLFLGDTNRTIAETAMNEYSSRSHCLFTIYISVTNCLNGKIRFSKLHLVDLAGSERVHKNKISGVILTEAKSINLSLHFLEQVIMALSEEKRPHVPYRNSLLTYMLKDSLQGNCLTVMLATLTTATKNLPETISTCKFAQRVAMVKFDAVINEKVDPLHQIECLKNKILELENQVNLMSKQSVNDQLTQIEQQQCQEDVSAFLSTAMEQDVEIDLDMRKIGYYFKMFKSHIIELSTANSDQEKEIRHIQQELWNSKDLLKAKDEEIVQLKAALESKPEIQRPTFVDIPENTEQLFEYFMSDPKNTKEVQYYNETIQKKYKAAKLYTETIEQCQKSINAFKANFSTYQSDEQKKILQENLKKLQDVYRSSIMELKELKSETDHLKFGLEQTQVKLKQQFQLWLDDFTGRKKDKMLNRLGNCPSDKRSNPVCNCSMVEVYRCADDLTMSSSSCPDCPAEDEVCSYCHEVNYNYSSVFPNCLQAHFDFPDQQSESLTNLYADSSTNKPSCPILKKDLLKRNCTQQGFNTSELTFSDLNSSECSQAATNKSHKDKKTFCHRSHRSTYSTVTSTESSPTVSDKNKQEVKEDAVKATTYLKETDSLQFTEFIKTIPLTGDKGVDSEIITFYRERFITT